MSEFNSMSKEEFSAMMDWEKARDQANKVLASRINKPGFNEFGKEMVEQKELTGIYKTSTLNDKIDRRRESKLSMSILFSDIDNTFYKKGQGNVTQELSQLLERKKWGLCYVTGRDLPGVENQKDLPAGDVVITSVGTEIFVRQKDGKYTLDEEFRNQLLENWDRQEIYNKSINLVDQIKDLEFQPRDIPGALEKKLVNESPQEFKISFWFFGEGLEAQKVATQIQKEIPNVRVIFSTDINDPKKNNIDLLPLKGGKDMAVKYLSSKIGTKGFTAGDSGNDLSMLVEGGHSAVIVGGAREEMHTAVLDFSKDGRFSDEVRTLPNDRKIYIGRDGTEVAANGLINVLQKGDFNPEEARGFISALVELRKNK